MKKVIRIPMSVIFIIFIIFITIYSMINKYDKSLIKNVLSASDGIKSYNQNEEIEKKSLKVLVLEFDPILKTKGNIKCSKYIGLEGNNRDIIEEVLDDLEYCSNGYVDIDLNYETNWIDTNEFPTYTQEIDVIVGKDANGNDITEKAHRLNEETWLTIMQNGWYEGMIHPKKGEEGYKDWYKYVDQIQGFCFDYDYIIDKYNLVERRNNGEFDFVFLSLIEPGNAYESIMVGKNAYWINGQPKTGYNCNFFPIIYANIVRKDGILHSVGHMAENILNYTFEGTNHTFVKNSIQIKTQEDYNKLNLWKKFTLAEWVATDDSIKKYGLGNVHFAPNSTKDYDNNNSTQVYSNWRDWRENYPNLKGTWELTNNSAWKSERAPFGDQSNDRLKNRWWFKSMPHVSGRTEDGYYNNWWKYITTLDYVKTISTKKPNIEFYKGETNQKIEWTCTYQSGKVETIRSNEDIKILDPSVLDVLSDGTLVGKKQGSTSIEVWRDGKKCTISVNVKGGKYTLILNPNGGMWRNSVNKWKVTEFPGTTKELGTATPPSGYEVTFNTNGGSGVSKITTTKEFDKWTLNSGAKGILSGTTYTFANTDDTVTANYKNVPITLPNTTKNGYTFEGWYTDSNLSNKAGDANSSYTVTKAMTLYAKWKSNTQEEKITSNVYIINEGKKIISKVNNGEKVEDFKTKITVTGSYKVTDKNGKELASNESLKTGCILKTNTKEYKIAVLGDLNGNGNIDLNDLAQVQKLYLELIKNDDLKLLSADFNLNGKVDLNDLAKMQKIFLGL